MWSRMKTMGQGTVADGDAFELTEYAEAAKAAECGIVRWYARSEVIRVDPLVDRILGLKPGTLSGAMSTFLARIHPRDRDEFEDVFSGAALRDEGRFSLSVRLRKEDNAYCIFRLSGEHIPSGVEAGAIGLIQDVTYEARATERLAINGLTDALTNLATKELFDDRIDAVLPLKPSRVALAYMRIKGLDAARTLAGPIVEDSVILATAKRIEQCDLHAHTISRTQRDGFGMFFVGVPDTQSLERKLERVLRRVCTPLRIADRGLILEASIGAMFASEIETDRMRLFKLAWQALREARAAEGDCVRIKTWEGVKAAA